MTAHIALLRGVNVGGRNMIAMPDLRSLFSKLGLTGARSLLQSGNIVFESAGRTAMELERLLGAETERRLKVQTAYFVRNVDEWKKIISVNPLPNEAKNDPSRLLVIFLEKTPAGKDLKALQASITGPEIVRTMGRQAYVAYPTGIGRSKLTTAEIEKKLGSRGTCRNWNTVLKLLALAEAPAS